MKNISTPPIARHRHLEPLAVTFLAGALPGVNSENWDQELVTGTECFGGAALAEEPEAAARKPRKRRSRQSSRRFSRRRRATGVSTAAVVVTIVGLVSVLTLCGALVYRTIWEPKRTKPAGRRQNLPGLPLDTLQQPDDSQTPKVEEKSPPKAEETNPPKQKPSKGLSVSYSEVTSYPAEEWERDEQPGPTFKFDIEDEEYNVCGIPGLPQTVKEKPPPVVIFDLTDFQRHLHGGSSRDVVKEWYQIFIRAVTHFSSVGVISPKTSSLDCFGQSVSHDLKVIVDPHPKPDPTIRGVVGVMRALGKGGSMEEVSEILRVLDPVTWEQTLKSGTLIIRVSENPKCPVDVYGDIPCVHWDGNKDSATAALRAGIDVWQKAAKAA